MGVGISISDLDITVAEHRGAFHGNWVRSTGGRSRYSGRDLPSIWFRMYRTCGRMCPIWIHICHMCIHIPTIPDHLYFVYGPFLILYGRSELLYGPSIISYGPYIFCFSLSPRPSTRGARRCPEISAMVLGTSSELTARDVLQNTQG